MNKKKLFENKLKYGKDWCEEHDYAFCLCKMTISQLEITDTSKYPKAMVDAAYKRVSEEFKQEKAKWQSQK